MYFNNKININQDLILLLLFFLKVEYRNKRIFF